MWPLTSKAWPDWPWGRTGRAFPPRNKKTSRSAFAELLGGNYIDRIREGYGGEDVTYVGQDMISDTKALVMTKIVRKTGDIPINYSMLLRDGHWRIYDVNIEGVSMVRNYRAQFDNILMNNSPAYLIERVKNKVDLNQR